MTATKKALSLVLSFVLAVGLIPAVPAMAAEANGLEDPQVGEAFTSGGVEQAPALESPQEDREEKPLDAAAGSLGVESEVAKPQLSVEVSAIEYIYIDKEVVSAGDTQLFAVGLTDLAAPLASASMEVVDDQGGIYRLDAISCIENAAAFEFGIAEDMPQGHYGIASISYQVEGDGASYEVDLLLGKEAGYGFSVGGSNATEDLGSQEDKSVGDVTAYSIGEDGSLVQEDSIEDAIQASDEQGAALLYSGASARSSSARSGNVVVALDPGHGTDPDTGVYDPGAIANGLNEADVNYKITQYCKEELEQYIGVTVLVTPRYRSVNARVDWAAANGATVYVSQHCNSASAGAYGFEIYCPNDSSFNYAAHVVGTELGQKIERQLAALGLYDRGVKYRDSEFDGVGGPYEYEDGHLADYYSAIERSRQHGFPGIIVEHAFVTNASDAAFLSNEANLKALGVADATGIAEQYGLTKGNPDDYWAVYSYDYYIEHNPDVYAAYGDDEGAVFRHFIEYGMKEGRQSSPIFDISYYRGQYGDLAHEFGDDLARYFNHFMRSGMAEGRQGSEAFSVESYYNEYPDVRRAYGTASWEPYYRHYLNDGIGEGRRGTGCGELVGWLSSLDGVDYSPVYDGAYYAGRNGDVAAFATVSRGYASVVDDAALLGHFVRSGMAEGRQGSEAFSVESYYNEYPDVRRAYGTASWEPYYRHYLEYGIAEGRHGIGCDEFIPDSSSAIMGRSQTTVAQMVRHFSKIGKPYPSDVYDQYGASTIDEFCSILFEESAAEGVRAEVVFVQAMHETGWLQFGGDVRAEQCNFAGIGATGGVPGASFNDWGTDSVRKGLRAQVQHLKAYASADDLVNECVDPRFSYVVRGSAQTIEELGGGSGLAARHMAMRCWS